MLLSSLLSIGAVFLVSNLIVRQFVELNTADVSRINLFLSYHLGESRTDLIQQISEQQSTPEPILLNIPSYTDVYRLDANLRVAEVLIGSEGSRVFPGFTLANTTLASVIQQGATEVLTYSLRRGIEDDQPGLYMAFSLGDEVFLARFNLEYLKKFLEDYAQLTGQPLLLTQNRGLVMLSSDSQLRITQIEPQALDQRIGLRDRITHADTRWLPFSQFSAIEGAYIVLLAPTAALDTLLRTLWIALTLVLMGLLLIVLYKLRRADEWVAMPLKQLLTRVEAMTEGAQQPGTRPRAMALKEFANLEASFQSMVNAVNQREQALSKLSQTIERDRARLERLLDGLPIAIGTITFDENPKTLFVNQEFTASFGYTLTDIPTVAAWAQQAYPDANYRDLVMGRWNRAIEHARKERGRIESMEFRVTAKTGEVRDAIFRAVALDDRLVVALTDVTTLRETEQALSSAQKELEKAAYELTENIPVGTYTMVQPADGGLAYFSFMSTRFLELTGLTREEAAEDPMRGFACVHPDDFDAWVQLNIEAFSEKKRFYGETRVVVDGEIRWITAESTPRTRDDGTTIWEGVLADITPRKMAEQALLEAKQHAEKLERAKSDFLASMSHEIRTPMNAVMGLTQLLQLEDLTRDQLSLVRRIERAGELLLTIIDDVLDLSKIESGKMPIRHEPFELKDLLQRLHDLYSPLLTAKSVTLGWSLAGDDPGALLGDTHRLEQVLGNLLSNAIKFTENGRVQLLARTTSIDAHSVGLELSVTDTGTGIAPEYLNKLFDPFEQGDKSSRREGTGLGLPISKRLIELMGGTIILNSQLEQGTEVKIHLRLPRADKIYRNQALLESIVDIMAHVAGRRFLVVDDVAVNRELLARFIEELNAEATCLGSAREALHVLSLEPEAFDAVLMDVQMPGMDGMEATRQIRGRLGLLDLPVIAFTAGVLEEQQQAARDAGMNDVLTKPVKLEVLARCLAKHLAHRAPAPSSQRFDIPDGSVYSCASSPDGGDANDEVQISPGFEAWPGFNMQHAMEMVDDDSAFFAKLVASFKESFSDIIPELRRELEAQQWSHAQRRLHSLKGAAAYLGAEQVATHAAALEAMLIAGDHDWLAKLPPLETALAQIL
ncbi:ATP-binding protein [Ectothiorhodosinus mongolicus]|uniref:ATP-binding protein n=1 Tax=Ectothiorhodosinus mongolicus TaxID=233100 RepID=UPI000975BAA5|nr:ATP-binding protein [Ectothiorhodosinus mongolicus]